MAKHKIDLQIDRFNICLIRQIGLKIQIGGNQVVFVDIEEIIKPRMRLLVSWRITDLLLPWESNADFMSGASVKWFTSIKLCPLVALIPHSCATLEPLRTTPNAD